MAKSSQHPRGQPHRSPADDPASEELAMSDGQASARPANRDGRSLEARLREAQAREAQMRRWMLLLALGTVAVVVVAVGVGVYFVNRALKRIDSDPAARSPAEARKLPEVPRELRPNIATRGSEPLLVPRDPPRDLPPRDRSLEAVGGLSAAHLYQTYLNIGMLADATENDVYLEEDARRLLTTIQAWMDSVDGQLNRLGEAGLDEDDQKKVAQVRRVTGLLRIQAKELRGYWDKPEADAEGKKQHEALFHKAREDAWAAIKELLGIKDE